MNDVVFGFFRLEVWDVQGANAVEGGKQRRVDLAAAMRRAHLFAHLPEKTQHARPIKSLPLTVFAETHGATTLLSPGVDPTFQILSGNGCW